MRRSGPSRDETGGGTVLVVGLVALALVGGVVLGALLQVVTARHRAEAGADLAALAGSQALIDGTGVPACRAVDEVARRNRVTVSSCRQVGMQVWVTTEVEFEGLLGHLGPATAGAHAGPGREG